MTIESSSVSGANGRIRARIQNVSQMLGLQHGISEQEDPTYRHAVTIALALSATYAVIAAILFFAVQQ